MRLLRKLTSAHAIALVALFVALAGTAGAAGVKLITGDDVQNRSLTGADVKNHSLGHRKLRWRSVGAKNLRRGSVRTKEVRNGSLRGRDFDHARLPGLTKATVKAPDVTNYVDRDPIVGYSAERGGDYIVVTRFFVTNTGPNPGDLNCAYIVGDDVFGTAGAHADVGQTTKGLAVNVVEAGRSKRLEFACEASGGPTTFDLSKIRLRAFRLG